MHQWWWISKSTTQCCRWLDVEVKEELTRAAKPLLGLREYRSRNFVEPFMTTVPFSHSLLNSCKRYHIVHSCIAFFPLSQDGCMIPYIKYRTLLGFDPVKAIANTPQYCIQSDLLPSNRLKGQGDNLFIWMCWLHAVQSFRKCSMTMESVIRSPSLCFYTENSLSTFPVSVQILLVTGKRN